MTTPVSAPKIEAKTDVKVIPPVKVEMTSSEDIQKIIYDMTICPIQVYHKWAKKNKSNRTSSIWICSTAYCFNAY
jgi:hypothetical protein